MNDYVRQVNDHIREVEADDESTQTVEELRELVARWRKIADDLVYTEHDDYDHFHRNLLSPCLRCVAHQAYHDQVNREENP